MHRARSYAVQQRRQPNRARHCQGRQQAGAPDPPKGPTPAPLSGRSPRNRCGKKSRYRTETAANPGDIVSLPTRINWAFSSKGQRLTTRHVTSCGLLTCGRAAADTGGKPGKRLPSMAGHQFHPAIGPRTNSRYSAAMTCEIPMRRLVRGDRGRLGATMDRNCTRRE